MKYHSMKHVLNILRTIQMKYHTLKHILNENPCPIHQHSTLLHNERAVTGNILHDSVHRWKMASSHENEQETENNMTMAPFTVAKTALETERHMDNVFRQSSHPPTLHA